MPEQMVSSSPSFRELFLGGTSQRATLQQELRYDPRSRRGWNMATSGPPGQPHLRDTLPKCQQQIIVHFGTGTLRIWSRCTVSKHHRHYRHHHHNHPSSIIIRSVRDPAGLWSAYVCSLSDIFRVHKRQLCLPSRSLYNQKLFHIIYSLSAAVKNSLSSQHTCLFWLPADVSHSARGWIGLPPNSVGGRQIQAYRLQNGARWLAILL